MCGCRLNITIEGVYVLTSVTAHDSLLASRGFDADAEDAVARLDGAMVDRVFDEHGERGVRQVFRTTAATIRGHKDCPADGTIIDFSGEGMTAVGYHYAKGGKWLKMFE